MTQILSMVDKLTHVIVPMETRRKYGTLSGEELEILRILIEVRDYLEREGDDRK